MNLDVLEFEQPIAELQAKIDELSSVSQQSDLNLNDEVANLEAKRNALIERIRGSEPLANHWLVILSGLRAGLYPRGIRRIR